MGLTIDVDNMVVDDDVIVEYVLDNFTLEHLYTEYKTDLERRGLVVNEYEIGELLEAIGKEYIANWLMGNNLTAPE